MAEREEVEVTPLFRAESMLRERLAWYPRDGSTHWQDCEGEHWQCATALVLDELERLRALLSPPSETREIERLRAENERLTEALVKITVIGSWCPEDPDDETAGLDPGEYEGTRMVRIARRALTATPEDRNGQ